MFLTLLRDKNCAFYSVVYGNLTLLTGILYSQCHFKVVSKTPRIQQSRERGIVMVYKLTGGENIAAVYLREMWP